MNLGTELFICNAGIALMVINAILLIAALIFIIGFLGPYLERKNDIREKECKNEKYKIFNEVDPVKINEYIDDYFEKYINRYITYKFISKKIIYIKQEDVDEMVRDLTKFLSLDISELYTYYISLITDIDDEESLVKYIHSRVMNISVEAVLSFNNSNIGS